jgi:hypothetical protein
MNLSVPSLSRRRYLAEGAPTQPYRKNSAMKNPSSLPHLFLLLGSLLGLPSCGEPGEDPVAAASLAEQTATFETARKRAEGARKLLQADFEKRQAEAILRYDTLVKSNDSLRSQLENAQDEAARTRGEFEACRARYKARLRAKAKGLALARVQTTEKTVFESAVVRELTPTEAAIAHSGGATRVSLATLPPELQSKLLYDPEEVEAMKAAKAAAAEAIAAVKEVVDIPVRDPIRLVNAPAVRILTNRIVSREAEILRAESEATGVKESPHAATNIGRYRIALLEGRVARWKNDLEALRTLLDLELNGPQSAGGPSER